MLKPYIFNYYVIKKIKTSSPDSKKIYRATVSVQNPLTEKKIQELQNITGIKFLRNKFHLDSLEHASKLFFYQLNHYFYFYYWVLSPWCFPLSIYDTNLL